MGNINHPQNNEYEKLIKPKTTSCVDNDDSPHSSSSRLESAESSWIGCFSLLFYSWINPILSTGSKRLLTEDDLDDLPNKDKASVLFHRLNSYDWRTMSTWKIIIQEFWKEHLIIVFYCLPYLLARISQPLLLREIVLSCMSQNSTLIKFCVLMLLLCLCSIVQALLDYQIYFYSMRLGIRIRNALSTIIYHQSLSIKLTMSQDTNIGQIINLISNDASSFEGLYSRLYYLWEAPLEALVIFTLLCWIIRPIPALLSCIVFFLSIIILVLVGHCLSHYRNLKASCSDERVHAFNELIHGYHIIKMYNWEKSIEDRINKIRQNEFHNLNRFYYLRIFNSMHSFLVIPLLALTSFGTIWLLDYPLNPADCFAALAFFGLLRTQVAFFMPLVTERVIDIQLSSKRIDAFLRLTLSQDSHSSSLISSSKLNNEQISMLNASFSWNTKDCCLSSLNINIQSGTFVGIVGSVGSGKSSLLAAILGELNLLHGQLNTNHNSFSYASQLPWIFPDTIRNNILLNRPFDEQRYRNVIYACCLDVDFESFGMSGDLTTIGERGINLSGGQRSRISLARTIYNDVDIYLIDDPLAAVDRTVAKLIYERCFSSKGLLKTKTRLLVTHQTQFLVDADQIIYLSNGHIDRQGHLEDCMENQEIKDKNELSEIDNLIDENSLENDVQSIISEETAVNGNINWKVLLNLFTSSSFDICGLCLLIILMIISEIFYDGTNYWLSIWLKDEHRKKELALTFGYTYLGLILVIIITDTLRTILFFSIILNGANNLHNKMLKSLLYTSSEFFESNPSGRILNRTSNDQKITDEELPTILLSSTKSLLMSIGSLVIICLVKPYLLLVIVVLIPGIIFLCRFYLRSKKQLKRLESVTRSPIYNLLSTSLNGLVTLRAFKIKDYFIQRFTDSIDRNTRVNINMHGAMRWLDVRLNLIAFINTFAIGMILISFRNQIDPSFIALLFMYAISIPKSIQLSILLLFHAELYMPSTERIHEYSLLPLEEEEDNSNNRQLLQISSEWPLHGTVSFENYSLRHRSGLKTVLNNLNLQIKSKEKIGIIGRTGAGKSSLFKGIFRLIKQSNITGIIWIDNIDISRISLVDIRSHLSIIPQQPILFSGTLRYNLDPFKFYSDEECWMALDDVQLKEVISEHPSGLEMLIEEGGNNLSVGQCQLICIARVILKKSKILLIDEATSNVDEKTDNIIQEIIAKKFQDRTVLTIAHRLNTIGRSDRIIVLDKGMIVNVDTPMKIFEQYQQTSKKL